MVPLDTLITYLQSVDEVQILELLDLKTENILERFQDIVEERREFLEGQMEILPSRVEDMDLEELDYDEETETFNE